MNNQKVLLKIRNLDKAFRDYRMNNWAQGHSVKALSQINLDIFENECFGIVGESGSGKSTLAKCILRCIESDKGEIISAGHDLLNLSMSQFKKYRQKYQIILQNAGQSLNPVQTIQSCLMEPIVSVAKKSKTEALKKVNELCSAVGLENQHLDRLPHQLSGGQKQRVAIARSLTLNPKLIIADEPTSNLDAALKYQVLDLLIELRQKYNLTLIIITHDMSVIEYMTDRMAVMLNGHIVEMGNTNQILKIPLHPYTHTLLQSANENTYTYSDIEETNLDILEQQNAACSYYQNCPRRIDQCLTDYPQLDLYLDQRFVACHLANDPGSDISKQSHTKAIQA